MVRNWFANGAQMVRVLSGFGCGSGVVRVRFGCEHPSSYGSQMVRKWFANGSQTVRVLSGFGFGSGVVRVRFGCEHPS